MIEKLSLQITELVCTEQYSNPKDKAKIQYAINILLSEGFKMLSLILFFNIIGHASYFYFSLIILISIRVFSGGVHANGILKCLIITLLLFVFTSVFAPNLPQLNNIFYFIISTFSIIILVVRAPICSVRRPIKSKKIRFQYKVIAISITFIWSIILFTLNDPTYINCGFLTILSQNIQLLLAKAK